MEEEPAAESEPRRRQGEAEEEEGQAAVYCAVGKDAAREWKANLLWVLANIPRSKRLVFVHLHRPASRINMMGAWVPVSQLAEQEVTAYRQLEQEKIEKVLDDLLDICKSQKVSASKITFVSDDAARGLVQFVDDHGVTELVMGAASDRAYHHRKMRAPRSKKALMVQRRANPSCKIWFVCKGNLICTREASEGAPPHRGEPSTTSTSPRSSVSDHSRSRSSPRLYGEAFSTPESNESPADQTRTREDLNPGAATGSSEPPVSATEPDQLGILSPDGSVDGAEMDDALYEKLKDAIVEAENLKHEAYEETRRRQMGERDLAEANKMADEAECSYQREAKHRKEVEEVLTRERSEMERDRQDLDRTLEQIRRADGRSAEMEVQIARSERTMRDLEAMIAESYAVLDSLRRQRGDDAAATAEPSSEEVETVSGRADDGDRRQGDQPFRRFGLSELDEATNRFDESVRIDGGGDGGRGKVYGARLRGAAVAVKVFTSPDVAVGEVRFAREAEAISRVSRQHPGLVALVGACPEARAVVYEHVPGGKSLEDLLDGLPWHPRCGAAYRTCAALAFLHSRGTVHGDVRPANILLLDAGEGDHYSSSSSSSSSCKLAGLGTRRLFVEHLPSGVCGLTAYADPRYLATGELTPRCDIYSLGVVLLRLVTGMPAFMARKAAQEAAQGGAEAWLQVVDRGCGWPVERAREVALVALRCCSSCSEGAAGELLEEARSVLEDALSAAPGRSPSVPSYFFCPILKEVMKDPQLAADGFSYEAEAIREWLDSGHHTSPMTNLRLPTRQLTPNHALRSAIQEWRHRNLHPS